MISLPARIAVAAAALLGALHIHSMGQELNDLRQQQAQFRQALDDVTQVAAISLEERSFSVVTTAYTAHPSETNGQPTITATMTQARPGKTAAVSRDLAPFLLGRKIYVPGFGVWEVQDLMNARHTLSVDLCMGSKGQAKQFGSKSLVVIALP